MQPHLAQAILDLKEVDLDRPITVPFKNGVTKDILDELRRTSSAVLVSYVGGRADECQARAVALVRRLKRDRGQMTVIVTSARGFSPVAWEAFSTAVHAEGGMLVSLQGGDLAQFAEEWAAAAESARMPAWRQDTEVTPTQPMRSQPGQLETLEQVNEFLDQRLPKS
jgi:hypothetical protein